MEAPQPRHTVHQAMLYIGQHLGQNPRQSQLCQKRPLRGPQHRQLPPPHTSLYCSQGAEAQGITQLIVDQEVRRLHRQGSVKCAVVWTLGSQALQNGSRQGRTAHHQSHNQQPRQLSRQQSPRRQQRARHQHRSDQVVQKSAHRVPRIIMQQK